MYKSVVLFASAWLGSVTIHYIHHRYCWPFFTGTSPCIQLQTTAMTMDRIQQSQFLLMISLVLEGASLAKNMFMHDRCSESPSPPEEGSSSSTSTSSSLVARKNQ